MRTDSKNFIGLSQFVHFYGVVEDRMDPLKTGRVRVRCLGFHTKDKVLLPTEDLPWAQVLLPITSSGISGVGTTPLGLVEGSWVVGYFRDSAEAQEPVILGSLPGKPAEASGTTGFYDPNGNYPKFINEPDCNRLAVNTQIAATQSTAASEAGGHIHLKARKDARETMTGIAHAIREPFSTCGTSIEGTILTVWDQPAIPYNAEYPYNHVYESESGHVREYDDTASNTRIFESHNTGTSYEVDHSGNKVDRIVGNHTELIKGYDNKYTEGHRNLSIDGHYNLFINKSGTTDNHYTIQVGKGADVNILVEDGRVNINAASDINVKTKGTYNLECSKYNLVVDNDATEDVKGARTSTTDGPWKLTGSRIDLN